MCGTNHIKRHLHCAEQQDSPPNITKYWPATKNDIPKFAENGRSVIYTGGRFDHDPNMNCSSRTRPFDEVTFRALEILYAKLLHVALRLSTQI